MNKTVLTVNEALCGFHVKSCQRVDELDAQLWELEHKRSGARLVWLDRSEENKTFGIAFQTQPTDDTGVFHILEHSVLCGSERYPVKEPFVELMKSSLNTFLNAMTFPDRTFYPVSSRNGQDFVNLLRIYMDAVLHPRIYQQPEIFRQEGWHYELDKEGRPSYKGVVFNEMKGALASPDSLLENAMNRCLFPDTCYRWVYGGDPVHIPELTYENFIDTHRRLYHPSNAYIYLDGCMDIEQILTILDREYLASYDRAPAVGSIPFQMPVDGGTAYVSYELGPQEDPEGRTILADGFVACTFRDRDVMMALRALSDVLCGGNQAPLNRCLLERGLAKSVQMNLHDGIQQPWVSLEARDIRKEKIDEVSNAIYNELERLVQDGLDHQRIMATLDNMELQLRQRDYGRMPQGLAFGFQVLESWIYGGDPGANLSIGDLFAVLRQKCEDGCFESLLEDLLRSPHRCRVILQPSHTIGLERQAEETAGLEKIREGWNQDTLAELRRQQTDLELWQNTPDRPEALASIPMLQLSQIPAEPEPLPLIEEAAHGLPVLRHELPTGGISYVNLYFALDDLPAGQLSQVSFLCDLLGSLDTASYSLEELQKSLRSRFGGLRFSVNAYDRYARPGQSRVFLCVSYSTLDAKAGQAIELLLEMMYNTNFSDRKKIFDLLCQHRLSLMQQIAANGHSFAVGRVAACYTPGSAVQEYTGGIAYLMWLKELEQNFQEKVSELTAELNKLCQLIFVRSRLTVSFTGADSEAEKASVQNLAEKLSEGTFILPFSPTVKPWERRNEGVIIPADVSFAAMGGVFPAAASGASSVMGRVVSLACLWNTVRVQGGAYGTGMILHSAGMAGFYSYRDPSAVRTLDCYRHVPDFLENLGDMELTSFILGTVAESDPLLTPRMKGKAADENYWKGVTQADRRRMRQEMLVSTTGDIMALSSAVRKITTEGAVCVLGSRKQLDACAGELNIVTAL